jgi:hypothetical protein
MKQSILGVKMTKERNWKNKAKKLKGAGLEKAWE